MSARYFLLDKVTEVVEGDHAVGVKCVSLTDPVVHDHFPGFPMLPGALLIEATAQLSGYLLEYSQSRSGPPEHRALLTQVDRAKFRQPAQPGDQVILRATIAERLDVAARVDVAATVSGKSIMQGTLTFMLKEVPYAEAHEQREYLYRLWRRDSFPERSE